MFGNLILQIFTGMNLGTDDLQSGEVEYFSTHKMGNFLESGEFPRFHGTFDKI